MKSTTKKGKCMSCGCVIKRGRPHVCDFSEVDARRGTTYSIPQRAKSNKLAFGKGGRR